jgi:carboxyl-terminal processing protease
MSMKSSINLKLFVALLAAVALLMIWTVGEGDASQVALQQSVYGQQIIAQTTGSGEDSDDGPKHSLAYYTKLMADIAYKIHTRYMEEVDPEDLVEAGIEGMLRDLDPYSVVMKPQSYDHLMENTQGKYEGVGMQIDLRDDRVTIITPIEGTPAYRLGLQAGDKIMMIDSTSTDGMSTQDAANLMRGPAGTTVTLTIQRPGIPEWLEYDVERAVIELLSVRYYGVIEDGIGYVRIDKFAEQTTDELIDAINDMTQNMGVEKLIFDLRSNGGGLLDQAISVANLFLPKDKLIVYTQGKYTSSKKKFHAQTEPLFPNGDLVVLVNGGTASASEIVSGAIQDWDRGVILGSTTFGKGLVQQIFGSHSSEMRLKLTTAKYYIPSGRCIQKPERAKKHPEEELSEPVALDVPESEEVDIEREIFLTAAGREVYGGGGVVPDIEIEGDRWKPIEYNLVRKNMFFQFAVDYTTRHPDVPVGFEVTDQMVEQFRQFIEEKEFDYKTALEYDLEKFEDRVREEADYEQFEAELADVKALIEQQKADDFDESTDYIRQAIKREILRKVRGERGIYEELTLKEDETVRRALEILRDSAEYGKLLQPHSDKS